MESDTFYRDFMAKEIWKLSGNFICHVFSIKLPDNLQNNLTIKSPQKVSLHTVSMQSPY